MSADPPAACCRRWSAITNGWRPIPNEGVAEYGFSRREDPFPVVLDPDGTLFSFDDIRHPQRQGQADSPAFLVPDGGGRSGTGLKPFFCWDNTGYALGRDNKGQARARGSDVRRVSQTSPVVPPRARERRGVRRPLPVPGGLGAGAGGVVAELGGGRRPQRRLQAPRPRGLHPPERRRSARPGCVRSPSKTPRRKPVLGVSLVSGEEEELARLHPQISGVVGANTTGAAIVSFNLDAFESYGKSQSYNAPVGTRDAFRYTTALNRLLADDARRVRIGDATVVFWSDRPEGGRRRRDLPRDLRRRAPEKRRGGARRDRRSR